MSSCSSRRVPERVPPCGGGSRSMSPHGAQIHRDAGADSAPRRAEARHRGREGATPRRRRAGPAWKTGRDLRGVVEVVVEHQRGSRPGVIGVGRIFLTCDFLSRGPRREHQRLAEGVFPRGYGLPHRGQTRQHVRIVDRASEDIPALRDCLRPGCGHLPVRVPGGSGSPGRLTGLRRRGWGRYLLGPARPFRVGLVQFARARRADLGVARHRAVDAMGRRHVGWAEVSDDGGTGLIGVQ